MIIGVKILTKLDRQEMASYFCIKLSVLRVGLGPGIVYINYNCLQNVEIYNSLQFASAGLSLGESGTPIC